MLREHEAAGSNPAFPTTYFLLPKRSNQSRWIMNAHGHPHALDVTGCAARHALKILILLCFLAAISTPACRPHESRQDISDNQTLQASFLSLKPGCSIAPATLHLRTGGALGIAIENEALADARGTWSQQQGRFSAAAEFTVARRPLFHYRLALSGLGMGGLYAGRARLLEYDRQDRLMQEIEFLFHAEAPGARALPGFGKDTAR